MPAKSLPTLLIAAALTLGAVACSGGDGDEASPDPTTTTAPVGTTSEDVRPEGPVAAVDRELTDGAMFIGAATGGDLGEAGYVEHEYRVSGTAASYDGELTGDGRWTLSETGETGDFATRVLVRMPDDPADASGTVLVEWLNVSGGIDANPDYAYLSEEILRAGHVWVGVSAQSIGVEGGPTAVALPGMEALTGKGLKGMSPERYGDLAHPGDAFSYDMYTQIARALRETPEELVGDAEVTAIYAIGESQSGYALTTYANGVQPLTRAFDAFFIHSRGAAPLPLVPVDGQEGMSIAESIGNDPVVIRDDLGVPVFMLQAESDVSGLLGFAAARQEDSDLIRTWEIAGAAHVDRHALGPVADLAGCVPPVNDGPHHLVAKAALRSLDTWVRDGTAPPSFDPLDLDDGGAQARDERGIATGGIRTPLVDVPVDILSGEAGPGASIFCLLAGSTVPLDDDVLAGLYEDAEDYTASFEASLDDAIEAGVILPEDREAALAMASPERLPG